MAVCVVAIHTHPMEQVQNPMVLAVYDAAVHQAVPFFFLASGYLLFYRFARPLGGETLLRRIKRYGWRSGILYLKWSVIYLPLAVYGYWIDDLGILMSFAAYVRGLFFIGEHYYSWPLWYLLSTVYAAAFLYIAYRWRMKLWTIWLASIGVLCASCGLSWLVASAQDLAGGWAIMSKLVKYIFGSGRIFSGVAYISTGMLLAAYRQELLKLRLGWVWVGVLVAFIFCVVNLDPFTELLLAVFLLEVARRVQLRGSSFYQRARLASIVIYLMHMLFFFVWTLAVGRQQCYGVNGFVFSIVGSSLVALLCICFGGTQRKVIRWLWG